jgi:integrase/recombinase XerD
VIGLMATAGLRTGEALRLDRTDVDPVAGTLTIVKSKWGKSRRIPLHPSTTDALLDYGRLRDREVPTPGDRSLLLHRRGTRIPPSTLQTWFANARTDANIPCLPGHRRPRAYDLRHTFAVHTLRDWHAAGLDVRQHLPVLSSYLGHVNPDNTYWYLQAVPELMNVLADRLNRYLATDEHDDSDPFIAGGRS